MNRHGLNGNGAILLIVDSVVDNNSCLFSDPRNSVLFNQINYDHQKIINYISYEDKIDKSFDRETHCAGVLAGSSSSGSLLVDLYSVKLLFQNYLLLIL
jgi:subtilisin family serine protease